MSHDYIAIFTSADGGKTWRRVLDPNPTTPLVELAAAPGLTRLTLMIDDRPVAVFSAPPYQFWWPLSPGTHTLPAEGENEESETITIQVIS